MMMYIGCFNCKWHEKYCCVFPVWVEIDDPHHHHCAFWDQDHPGYMVPNGKDKHVSDTRPLSAFGEVWKRDQSDEKVFGKAKETTSDELGVD